MTQKVNCENCVKGFCYHCRDPKLCLCASANHNQSKSKIEEMFTQKMVEVFPTYAEFKEQMQSYTPPQFTLYNEPLEDIKPNRWITLGEQKDFCDFLNSIGYNPDQLDKLEWCASEWEKYQCAVHHDHSKKVKYIACGRRGLCPRCSKGYASKRAAIMYSWIRENVADRLDFDLKMNEIVLTLPESLHDMGQKLFSKMIKKFMKSFDIEAFGYCIQTRHSTDPLAERYIHAHILSLNLRVGEKYIHENNYYFDVDEMRQVWKKIIEKNTDVTIEGDVNLHTEYMSIIYDQYKVLHKLAYLYRYPVEDLFNVQVRQQTINYVQSQQFEKIDGYIENSSELKLVRSKVEDLLSEKKPRIVWCGLLTSVKRKKLIKLILNQGLNQTLDGTPYSILQIDDNLKPSFRWKSMKEIEKEIDERSKICRDCGSPYEEEPFERGDYTGDNEPEVN